jgi:hypothetical protein
MAMTSVRKSFFGIVLIVVPALASVPAQAEGQKENLPASIEKRLQEFDPSPLGQSIETKMPQVLTRMPAMAQVLMPLIRDDVRAKMKAKGKDLPL